MALQRFTNSEPQHVRMILKIPRSCAVADFFRLHSGKICEPAGQYADNGGPGRGDQFFPNLARIHWSILQQLARRRVRNGQARAARGYENGLVSVNRVAQPSPAVLLRVARGHENGLVSVNRVAQPPPAVLLRAARGYENGRVSVNRVAQPPPTVLLPVGR